jgi:hypothetical protein
MVGYSAESTGYAQGRGGAATLEKATEDLLVVPAARSRMGDASRELLGEWTRDGKAERVMGALTAASVPDGRAGVDR